MNPLNSIDPAGLVLGTIQVMQGMSSGSSGFRCSSGIATYTPTSGPAAAADKEVPAVRVGALGRHRALDVGIAVIHLHAAFGQTATGPYIANARFKVEEEYGFDDLGVEFDFVPLPTPVGTWDDPWVQFDAYLNIKVDGYDDAKCSFVLSVNRNGSLHATDPQFQYGRCDVSWGNEPKIEFSYNGEKHG